MANGTTGSRPDTNDQVISARLLVAVGAIAGVEHAVLAENPTKLVQARAMEGRVLGNAAVHAGQHLGDLQVHLRPPFELAQVPVTGIACRRRAGDPDAADGR